MVNQGKIFEVHICIACQETEKNLFIEVFKIQTGCFGIPSDCPGNLLIGSPILVLRQPFRQLAHIFHVQLSFLFPVYLLVM